MQRFEYRGPRFSCDLPVQLIVNDATLSVRCTEISKTGMKLEMGHPQEINSIGKVSIIRNDRTLEFRVRFAHVGQTHAGLDVIYSSNGDREAMDHLIDSVTAAQGARVRCI